MRKRLLTKLLLLAVAGLALGAAGFALADTTTLSLTYSGPEPDTVTVPWGETLEITNEDTIAHQLVSSHEELQTGSLLPGQSFVATFTTKAHSYSYRQIGGRGYPGKVVVDFSGHVSLRASRSSVAYGRAVTLSGTTSLGSTEVAIQIRRVGDARWRLLRTVDSRSSGAYSTVVRFQRGGRLRATVAAGQIRSGASFVHVRPRLTAFRGGGAIVARLNPARAASSLTLECRVGPGRWKRVASKRPNAKGVVSFAARGRRTLVRVSAAHGDLADGYAPVSSRALSAGC